MFSNFDTLYFVPKSFPNPNIFHCPIHLFTLLHFILPSVFQHISKAGRIRSMGEKWGGGEGKEGQKLCWWRRKTLHILIEIWKMLHNILKAKSLVVLWGLFHAPNTLFYSYFNMMAYLTCLATVNHMPNFNKTITMGVPKKG